jgi:hypothetical protein
LSTPDMGKQMVESIDKFKKIVVQAKIPVE